MRPQGLDVRSVDRQRAGEQALHECELLGAADPQRAGPISLTRGLTCTLSPARLPGMSHLDNGIWRTNVEFPTDKSGAFTRDATTFRDHDVVAAPGRYQLYVSYACPWAHRTLIARALLGLESAIGVSIVHPFMGDDGWTFDAMDGVVPDPILGASKLWEVYRAAKADFTGRVTVPVLWDRERATIVNNESREILRLMTTVLAPLGHGRLDLAPVALRPAIETALDAMYPTVNNGVYRCGFAKTQAAYDRAVEELFVALDAWVSEGKPPPASRVPTLGTKTLVPADRIGFPKIPGLAIADFVNSVALFGDWVEPKESAPSPYRPLVSKVAADGNEIAGLRLPGIEVPLATYTGWNLYKAPFTEGELCDRDGSYSPLPATKKEREASGDPRASLEERYGTHANYVKKVASSARALVRERLLLAEDAERYVKAASNESVAKLFAR